MGILARPRVRRRTWAGIGGIVTTLMVAAMLPVWPVLHLQADEGPLADLRLHGDRFTISYVHSIDNLPIEETLQLQDGTFVVQSTRVRQFGAGMGHRPGEGSGHADGEWWVLSDLDRQIGSTIHLRVGPARIDHRLRTGDLELALSGCVPTQRVTLTPGSVSTFQLLLGSSPTCEPAPTTASESERP